MSESKFDGTLLGLIGVRIVSFLITAFTLGIGVPWAVTYHQRWLIKHQTIDGKQLVFDGTGGQLFGNYIKWFLLAIITLGIYGLWIPLKIQAWVTKHTHFETKILYLEDFDTEKKATPIEQPKEKNAKAPRVPMIIGLGLLVLSSVTVMRVFIQFIIVAIRFGMFPVHPLLLLLVLTVIIMIVFYIVSITNGSKKTLKANMIIQIIGFAVHTFFAFASRFNNIVWMLVLNMLLMMAATIIAVFVYNNTFKKEKEKNILQ
jgi:hypothetical protein